MFLTSSGVDLFAQDYPTDEKVAEIIESAPDLVIDMVQKLYVLEHADPLLFLPPLMIFETENNISEVKTNISVVSFGDGKAELKIGTDEHNLLYYIELDVEKVIYTEDPKTIVKFDWVTTIISVSVSFGLGFLLGYVGLLH